MEKPHDPELDSLREKFGRNKRMPSKYEKCILTALSRYHQLKDECIDFVTTKKAKVPYNTKPSPWSLFMPAHKRRYVITILTKAEEPVKDALLKNLPEPAQIGVIAHELGHVVQYKNMSALRLIKTLFSYSMASFRRKIEREADKLAIEHGLGEELYMHAVYIRNIPGYIEKRKEINENYLLPPEIIQYLHTEYTPHIFRKNSA